MNKEQNNICSMCGQSFSAWLQECSHCSYPIDDNGLEGWNGDPNTKEVFE